MPLPTPHSGEQRNEFVRRCMSDPQSKRDFPDRQRRLAVCFRQASKSIEMMKPFPNEHAARLKDPGKFIRFRRQNDRGGPGVDFIFGVAKDQKTEIQAIRFDKNKFTVAQAKQWLTDHNFKPISFEPATG